MAEGVLFMLQVMLIVVPIVLLVASLLLSFLPNRLGLILRRKEYHLWLRIQPKVIPLLGWTFIILLLYAFIQWAYTQPSFGFAPINDKDHAKTVWDWIGQISLSAGGAIIAILYTEGQKKRDQRSRRFTVLDSFRKEMRALQSPDSNKSFSDEIKFYMRELVLGTLIQLDVEGKEAVFMFLCTSALIKASHPVINLARADFSWINIAKYTNGLEDICLEGVTLIGADLEGIRLTDCTLRNAQLWYANVHSVTFSNTPVTHTEISQDQLRQAVITN